jgi:hypothetical protein
VKSLWFAGAVLASVALMSGTVALACGDKLLSPGSVVRFRLIYASHPATVLIYSHGNQSIATLRSAKLQSTIKDAGLKLQTADSPSQLDEALKLGKADVVVADLADIAGITRQLQEAPSKPVVLPVLFKPSKAELSAAQKDYKFALQTPSNEIQFLTTIDAAMKYRSKTHGKS